MKSTKKKKQCSALGHVWSACQLEGQPNTHHCLHRHCLCRSPCQLTTAWTHSVCAGHPANSPLPGPTLRRSPLYAHSLSLKPKVPFTDNTKLSPPYWQYKAISPLLTIQSYLPFTDNTKLSPLLTIQSYLPFTDNTKLSPLYWQYKALPFTDNTKLSPLYWQYKAISPLLTIQSYHWIIGCPH